MREPRDAVRDYVGELSAAADEVMMDIYQELQDLESAFGNLPERKSGRSLQGWNQGVYGVLKELTENVSFLKQAAFTVSALGNVLLDVEEGIDD